MSARSRHRLAVVTTSSALLAAAPAGAATTHSFEPPANRAGWHRTPVQVHLASTDPGVTGFRYRVDDGPWLSAAPGTPVTIGEEGVHSVTYAAEGDEGERRAFVRIDRTRPKVALRREREVAVRDALAGAVRLRVRRGRERRVRRLE